MTGIGRAVGLGMGVLLGVLGVTENLWAHGPAQGPHPHGGIARPASASDPLAWVENLGQWPGDFAARSYAGGVGVFSSRTALRALVLDPWTPHGGKPKPKSHRADLAGFAFELALVGASGAAPPSTRPEPSGPVEAGTVTYLVPQSEGAGGAGGTFGPKAYQPRAWQTLRYSEVYPGISWVHTLRGGRQAHDFELAPFADPGKIRMTINGARHALEAKGTLRIETPYGPVWQTAPRAWQLSGRGGRDTLPVACRWVISKGGGLSFAVGPYDRSRPLTIDPTLIFSTYSSSRADNWGMTATYDEAGHMINGGIVFGPGFPATLGALDTTFRGTVDIGLAKYSPDGLQRLWATYLGGSGTEVPHSLVAGADGSVYVLGTTGSADFPTTATARQRVFAGGPLIDPMGYRTYQGFFYPQGSDLVVCRLSADGATLLGSTFLGGSDNDGLLFLPSERSPSLHANYGDCFRGEITLDPLGRPCLVATTFSTNFPMTAQAPQRSNGGGSDAVLARLSPGLDTLLHSTYFGGSADETGFGLAFDTTGRTYLTGGTLSTNLPGRQLGLQTTLNGAADGYLAALTPAWDTLAAATYLGTVVYDQSFLVQTDRQGRVYVAGQTLGNWPITPGTTGTAGGGQTITCLTPSLASTVFSTSYGEARTSSILSLNITAFLVDDCGKIYVAGWAGGLNYIPSSSVGLPVTSDAFRTTTDGQDFHLIVLDDLARGLLYGTFFGANSAVHGDHVDGGTSRFDKRGVVYQAVCACGVTDFPATAGVAGPDNLSGGRCNNAGFKFDFSLLEARVFADRQRGCAPLTVNLTDQSRFARSSRLIIAGVIDTVLTDTSVAVVIDRPGRYRALLEARNPETCRGLDTAFIELIVDSAFVVPDTIIRYCELGSGVTLLPPTLPAGTLAAWRPGGGLTDTASQAPVVIPSTQPGPFRLDIRTAEGCESERLYELRDGTLSARLSVSDTAGCAPLGVVAQVLEGRGQISWLSGEGGSDTVGALPLLTYAYERPGLYWLRLVVQNDTTCAGIVSDSVAITVGAPGVYADTTLPPRCPGDRLRLEAPPGFEAYRWDLLAVGDSTRPALEAALGEDLPGGTLAAGPIRVTMRDRLGCLSSQTFIVREDSLMLAARIDTVYDPCRDRFTVRLTGSGSRVGDGVAASQLVWRPLNSNSGTDSVMGPRAEFTLAGSRPDWRVLLTGQAGGCRAQDTLVYALVGRPAQLDVSFSARWQVRDCARPPVLVLEPQVRGAGRLLWSLGDGAARTDSATITYAYAAPGTYRVSLIGFDRQCRADYEETITLPAQIVGNLVLPNGAEENRRFAPQPAELRWQVELSDRWGRRVYSHDDYPGDWPRPETPAGTYFYHLRESGGLGVECRGWVEVAR